MESEKNASVGEEWIKKKLNISHENLDDIKAVSLPGTYQEKLTHLGDCLIKFTRLKELDLSRNALHSLAGLEHLKLLEKLNLYYNNIGSLKELERLKHNQSLVELDLRLNPVTKEENDYRLFLIKILPNLKILDDRSIRDSEREMAFTFLSSPANKTQNGFDGGSESNTILARVKSVSNIAKRSAGINDENVDINTYRNIINSRIPFQNNVEIAKSSTERLNTNGPKADQYSPRGLKEVLNLESQNNKVTGQNGYANNSPNSNELNKLKSYSMMNLRALNNGEENNQKQVNRQSSVPIKSKSVHFNEIASYLVDDSNHSSSDNAEEEESTVPIKSVLVNKALKDSDKIDLNEDNNKKNPIFELLDVVDRYWNGSKSLHKNPKFLASAHQILNGLNEKPVQAVSQPNDEQINMLHTQIKLLQEENRHLKQELNMMRVNKQDSNWEFTQKNLINEIESLNKKFQALQEENNNLRKELSENQSQKATNGSANRDNFNFELIQSQNDALKHDIEIMKIKLKQFEHMQQLTLMLQESHKSLVATNEHLLEEISKTKTIYTNHDNSNYFKLNGNTCPHHGSSFLSNSISPLMSSNMGDSQQFIHPRLATRNSNSALANRFNTEIQNK